MRSSKVLAVVLTLVGGYIAHLPEKVAEHTFVGRIADAVSVTLGKLGLHISGIEGLISTILLLLPYLAVAGIFYLYHSLYVQPAIRAKSLVVADEAFSIRKKVETGVAAFFIACFIAIMALASYEYRAPASDSLKFSGFSALSNYELRERALSVGGRLLALHNDYIAKQKKVNEPYEKELAEWTKKSDEYKKQLADYNERSDPFSLSRFQTLGKPETPSFPLTTLGTGSSLGTLSSNPFGETAPPSPVTSGLVLKPPPMPPAPPPAKPEPPIVRVDSGWKDAMTDVQEEASAVWEEICHRSGGYPPMFTIPISYNYSWPAEGDLSEQAARLERLANSLH